MLAQPMKALLLLDVEPVLDAADAAAAQAALQGSGLVVALTAFKDAVTDHADVLLPLHLTETSAPRMMPKVASRSSRAWSSPWATPARPGRSCVCWATSWPSMELHQSSEQLSVALGDLSTLAARLDDAVVAPSLPDVAMPTLERVADVQIYAADSLVRRAASVTDRRRTRTRGRAAGDAVAVAGPPASATRSWSARVTPVTLMAAREKTARWRPRSASRRAPSSARALGPMLALPLAVEKA